MPLPRFRKFILVNNSGSLLSFTPGGRINIKETTIHYNLSTGKLIYTVLADDDLGFASGTLANGAEIVGDNEVDNTSNLFISSQVQIEITHDEGTAADGTFDLYMVSGDATGELESDANGYASAEANKLDIIGSLTWEPSGLDDEVMRSQTFNIG
jgi:hypothetical protein